MKYYAFLVCCFVVISAQAKPAPFRYKATPGDSLKYHITKTDTSSAMGQDQSGTFTADITIKAESSNDTQVVYTGAFRSLNAIITQPMMGLQDSNIAMPDLLGKRIRLGMTPAGKVVSTAIIDTPDVSDPIVKALAAQTADLMQPWFELPSYPVALGETWTIEQIDSNGDGNSMVYDTTTLKCKYEHNTDTLHHSCAVFSFTTKVSKGGTIHAPQGEIDLDGTGTGTGIAYFDAKKGMLIASSNKSDYDLNFTLAAMQKTITQTQSSIIHESIVE